LAKDWRGKKKAGKTRDWEANDFESNMEKTSERVEKFITTSSEPVERLYTPENLQDIEYDRDLGFPGQPPFTRGVYPTMYRGRLWTMRMYSGFGTAEQTNERYQYLLKQGQTGLSVAFDLPTQIGYDSDHPMAAGEVGKCGVAIPSVEDMATLFQGIPLDKVSTSMTINAPAAVLLAMYIAIAKRQSVDPKVLRGTIQNDILKEYVARGTYIYPPAPSMRLITDTIAYCRKELPRWNTISISGYHIREAGSTAIQEVAFTFANGIAYVQAAIDAGLHVDEFAPRLSFFFGAHNDLFEEVAKFRAARRLWFRIMRDRFNAEDPRSWLLRFHTQTAGCSLTAQQPENNIVRVTMQALAAVLGGTLKYLDQIDKMGGVLRAIETGFIQREIHDSAYRYQREIETDERVVVGVNRFGIPEEERTIEYLRVDPAVEKAQHKKLERFRRSRNATAVKTALSRLTQAAEGTENLFPSILEAVEVHATLGEISDTLRSVFGEHKPAQIF
jgi:methylmalonyl-CoA mutase N-terminal domain/subunit